MARQVSGIFLRNDRVQARAGTTVRVFSGNRKASRRALLLELGTTTLLLGGIEAPDLGSHVAVAITLPGRYIEFEVEGSVEAHHDTGFAVALDYLSARQAYGLTLARELLRGPAVAPAPRRAARS